MRRLLFALLVLVSAAPASAQIGVTPGSLAPPVIVFPASAVNGAGTMNVACFTFPSGSTVCENASGTIGITGTTPMLQVGGTTSSFPALLRSGSTMRVVLADNSGFAALEAATYRVGTVTLITNTAPTISSGFGTSPAILSSNGTATFRVNVGTGGVATSGVIALPAATTGWNCVVSDFTNNTVTRETASTTTTVTVTAAAAWAASDTLIFNCAAY